MLPWSHFWSLERVLWSHGADGWDSDGLPYGLLPRRTPFLLFISQDSIPPHYSASQESSSSLAREALAQSYGGDITRSLSVLIQPLLLLAAALCFLLSFQERCKLAVWILGAMASPTHIGKHIFLAVFSATFFTGQNETKLICIFQEA